MKKLYLILGIAALITACTGEKSTKNEFILNGKFADANSKFEGKEIYLMKFDEKTDNYFSLDTTTVTNGTFTFHETLDTPNEVRFISTYGFPKAVFFVGEAGNIELDLDSMLVPTLKGTELNDKYQAYLAERQSSADQIQEIKKEAAKAKEENRLTPEYEKELEKKFDSLYDGTKEYIFSFAKENITNPIGQYILIDKYISFDKDQLEQLFSQIDEESQKKGMFVKPRKRFNILKATAVGNNFTDIKGLTPDGKPLALSDIAGKGKYVLVDFWASWCPPCRKDMPEVVKLYNQYKSKGFEIVGVSLDSDNAAWVKGIKDLKITWPQVSDLKGWQTELGGAYAVNSIPHMVLLDKEGKIVANKITVPELSDKLAELLK